MEVRDCLNGKTLARPRLERAPPVGLQRRLRHVAGLEAFAEVFFAGDDYDVFQSGQRYGAIVLLFGCRMGAKPATSERNWALIFVLCLSPSVST